MALDMAGLQLRGRPRNMSGALPGGRAGPQQDGDRSCCGFKPPWRSSLYPVAQCDTTGLAIFMPAGFLFGTPGGWTSLKRSDSWHPLWPARCHQLGPRRHFVA